MHDIKLIRDNPENFSKKLSYRNVKLDIKELLRLDKKNRDIIQKKEGLEEKKKLFLKKKIRVYFKNLKNYQLK